MILVNVWVGAPFFMIMYLAALKSVPEQLYEAAAIDGANWWQKMWYITLPMMRNIIAITVLFSLIVTFANFDIVRVLTAGGPVDQTHVFATWAFKVGIEGSDLPLGACGVAVHVPDPRPSRRSSSCATSPSAATRAEMARRRSRSMKADRRKALVWSYFFLGLFVVFFLTPPIYMLITSLKTNAEISAAAPSPWWIAAPTLDNYVELLTSSTYLTFFRNSALVVACWWWRSPCWSASRPPSRSSRMKFWGSTTLATGVFLTYLIPETLLFIPLFKIFVWCTSSPASS